MTIQIHKPYLDTVTLKTVVHASIALSGRTYNQDEFDLIKEGFELVEEINKLVTTRAELELWQDWIDDVVDTFNRKAWEFENGKLNI